MNAAAVRPVVDPDRLPTVLAALSRVMADVQAVRKGDRNQQQGFNFRGIDAVVNAVGPALREHGVVVVPLVEDVQHEAYTTKNGAQMRNTTVKIRWRFYGPQGDHIEAVTLGEASDAGDKSVSKAHSVAFRTALLQSLCIPTDEPDPDSAVYERAPQHSVDERGELRAAIADAGKKRGQTPTEIADDFVMWNQGISIREADAATLQRYLDVLTEQHTEEPS